jgi:hypothetical protein
MSDIGRRIQRYRLSRYAPQHRLSVPRWAWIGFVAWGLWAGLVSDHSFVQLWRMERASAREHATLERTRAELGRLDRQTRDPRARLSEAERHLREQDGWARPNEIIYRIDDGNSPRAKP